MSEIKEPAMYFFDYQSVKNLDSQRRSRSLARYETSRLLVAPKPARPIAEVIEVAFPEDCQHAEQLGA